ncbi:TnsA endonuclease N-terminal domain-containing protein [Rubrivivax sp. RP6-9]|uniref:TnsA endonuclease N-terminal domain-containing protein n=1 Tax=Rubrivivax sp. RP6-9 TaxID=3415750 RepID=UPI003CC606FE
MSRGIKKWTEAAIAKLLDEGRGKGRGRTYMPWVYITDLYSEGRTHEPYSHKTGRTHQLLSDGERDAFVMLEWAHDVVDIWEQYPLPRELSLDFAGQIGVRHPYYPGTHVPTVMTLDFVAVKAANGKEVEEAFSVKVQEDLNDPKVVERLELERAMCQALGMPYRLLIKERMPHVKLRNLHWIRDAQLDPDAIEPFPGFYEDHKARMVQDIAARRFDGPLVDYCAEYDRRYSVESGTAMRVARMLLSKRALTMDLNNPTPQMAHMDCFKLSALPGRLRAIGGA